MRCIAAVLIGVCCSVAHVYAEDNCESAVDDADSMNVNRKDCDYTKEGLNGVLHKAFKKGSEGAVLETTAEKSVPATQTESVLAAKKSNKPLAELKSFSLGVDVDQWSGTALARTQLLPKAMEKCAKGFSIQSENYRPLAMGRISLTIEFSCLE